MNYGIKIIVISTLVSNDSIIHWKLKCAKWFRTSSSSDTSYIPDILITKTGTITTKKSLSAVLVAIWDVTKPCSTLFTMSWLVLSKYLLNIEGGTKWPPFRRRHFQIHFIEWKLYEFRLRFPKWPTRQWFLSTSDMKWFLFILSFDILPICSLFIHTSTQLLIITAVIASFKMAAVRSGV